MDDEIYPEEYDLTIPFGSVADKDMLSLQALIELDQLTTIIFEPFVYRGELLDDGSDDPIHL